MHAHDHPDPINPFCLELEQRQRQAMLTSKSTQAGPTPLDRARSPIHEAFTTGVEIPRSSWIDVHTRPVDSATNHSAKAGDDVGGIGSDASSGRTPEFRDPASTAGVRHKSGTSTDYPAVLAQPGHRQSASSRHSRPPHGPDPASCPESNEQPQASTNNSGVRPLPVSPAIPPPRPVHTAAHHGQLHTQERPSPPRAQHPTYPPQSPTSSDPTSPPPQLTSAPDAMLIRLKNQLIRRQPLSKTWSKRAFHEELAGIRDVEEGSSAGGGPGADVVGLGGGLGGDSAKKGEGYVQLFPFGKSFGLIELIPRSRTLRNRPISLYASPAALAAFDPLPLVSPRVFPQASRQMTASRMVPAPPAAD